MTGAHLPRSSSSGRLYTPQMLALATRLATYPSLPDAPLHGAARSETCGGSLKLDLVLEGSNVRAIGMLVQACAVGQASAALFADWAGGREQNEIAASANAVIGWLSKTGPLPSSPDLSPVQEALAYPARHGAILLPWQAFADALAAGELQESSGTT